MKSLTRMIAGIALTGAAAGILLMKDNKTSAALVSEPAANPLTEKWIGPYGGVPAFDKVRIADFKPALENAIAENLAEIDAIANSKAAPTFENTIVAASHP